MSRDFLCGVTSGDFLWPSGAQFIVVIKAPKFGLFLRDNFFIYLMIQGATKR